MKQMYNKHAAKAGYGEKGSDGTTCLYWMVHFFRDKVRGPKLREPTATREKICFHILDRWNLPISLVGVGFCNLREGSMAEHTTRPGYPKFRKVSLIFMIRFKSLALTFA